MGCSTSKATQAAQGTPADKVVEVHPPAGQVHQNIEKKADPPAKVEIVQPATVPAISETTKQPAQETDSLTDHEAQEALPPPDDVPGTLPDDAKIIFVLGGPGSGDLLRDEVKRGSELGHSLEVLMKDGKLVPQGVTIALLRNAMIRSGKSTFLIDGFPRALDQAHTFEEAIRPPEAIIFFDCPEAVMEERLLSRAKTSGRSDDQIDTIKKRFVTYQQSTLPVIELYREKGKLHHISAVPPPDEVFAILLASLEKVDSLVPSAPQAAEDSGVAAPAENGKVDTHVAPTSPAEHIVPEGAPTPVEPVTYEEAKAPDATKSIASHVIRVTEENSTVAEDAGEGVVHRRTGSVAAEGNSSAQGDHVVEENSDVAQAALA